MGSVSGVLSPEKIVDATLAAIDENGIEGVSLRDVTNRLGVTPPALYDHFDGKDALLRAVADRMYRDLGAQLGAAGGTDLERAIRGFRAYAAMARAHPRRYGLLLRYPPPAVSVADSGSELASAGTAYDLGAGPVRDAITAGALPPADLTLAPLVTWAMAHGIATLLVHGHFDDATADRLVEEAIVVLFGSAT